MLPYGKLLPNSNTTKLLFLAFYSNVDYTKSCPVPMGCYPFNKKYIFFNKLVFQATAYVRCRIYNI